MKRRWHKGRKGERGQVLLLTMILMLLGGIIIIPLLSYMSTGLMSGRVFENKADELYAADSGVEDGLWQIKNDQLSTKFPTYDPYDYSTTNWNYNLAEKMNGKNVNVNIQNVWIPKGISTPTATEANSIVQAFKLIVTGSPVTGSIPPTYKIDISYNRTVTDPTLKVKNIGVWLPPGFSYAGSCSLYGNYTYSENVTDYASNKAVVWTFNTPVSFINLPGVQESDTPMRTEITFCYSATQSGATPEAIAWIETQGVSDIPYSWDADVKVYKIISTAGSATVEAYTIKSELRQLSSAINGDYWATGKSLLIDDNSAPKYRDLLLTESSSSITAIPTDAQVVQAYLYWSGWVKQYANGIFWDYCGNLVSSDPNYCKWSQTSSAWTVSKDTTGDDTNTYLERFRGSYYGLSGESGKYLTMKSNVDLSGVTNATIRWRQATEGTLESSDRLYFSISKDGGANWNSNMEVFRDDNPSSPYSYAIPADYLTSQFRMRFYLYGFAESGEYVYIDDILITDNSITSHADTKVSFTINGHKETITPLAEDVHFAQVLSGSPPTYTLDGWYYGCRKDVTDLIRNYSNGANLSADPKVYGDGDGAYTVGDMYADTKSVMNEGQRPEGELADSGYAGWSLVIIYSSPTTKGHFLYLYDNFRSVPSTENNSPPVVMSGFIVPEKISGESDSNDAAKLTIFVGEGDIGLTGDYVAFVGQSSPSEHVLWDGTTYLGIPQTYNVWNGLSREYPSDTGVDIDSFHITWGDGWLKAGDTSAKINMHTYGDGYVLIYMIVSLRSVTTTGGTITYLIRG